jgi:hypothetical protein
MKPYRTRSVAAVLAGALLVPIASPADAAAPKRPKTGRWMGATSQDATILLDVTRRQVKLVGFAFDCGGKTATTGLQHLRIKRDLANPKKYAFLGTAQSAAAYADEDGGETVQVSVYGVFKTRTLAKGTLQVSGGACGDSGKVTWYAAR